jgi:hypothetical protein
VVRMSLRENPRDSSKILPYAVRSSSHEVFHASYNHYSS